jgi:homoserine dehydrogenase
VREGNMNKAIAAIQQLETVIAPVIRIRLESLK